MAFVSLYCKNPDAGPTVYVFDDVEYQKTRLQKLGEKIKRGESVGKPVLDRNRQYVETADNLDEATELALNLID